MVDSVLSGRYKIRLYLALDNRSKKVLSTLNNVLYMSNSSYNLMSLEQINNSKIFYNNKNKTLYDVKT